MRIIIHIGMDGWAATRIQDTLDAKREGLITRDVLYPRAPGRKNHTRLFMAVTDPGHVDPLRFNRGFITPPKQQALRQELAEALAREVDQHKPSTLILSASQLGPTLLHTSELERLKALLAPLSTKIGIVAHVQDQATALARHFAEKAIEGRSAGLKRELMVADEEDWWQFAMLARPDDQPAKALFPDIQMPPPWLDYAALVRHWDGVFGTGATQLRGFDPKVFASADLGDEMRASFDLPAGFGRAVPARIPDEPPAAWTTRATEYNRLLLKLVDKKGFICSGSDVI